MSDSETDFLVVNQARHLFQYLVTFAASLGALSLGSSIGYSSPAGAQLTANSTNTSGLHITTTENAWFSSSLTLGLIVGGLFGGTIINTLGHCKTMIFINFPYLLGWIIIGTARNFVSLIIGRAMQGVCGGVLSSVVPMYISEIASNDIRGRLGGSFQLMITIGILLSYILGALLSWQMLCIPLGLITVIQVFALLLCPDSPKYYIKKNNLDKCKKALSLLRGPNYDITEEFHNIESENTSTRNTSKNFIGLLRSWERKPFFICIILFFFQQFSGVTALLFNLENIFKNTGSHELASLSGILVGAVQVGATALGVTMMDKLGRKILLNVSIFVMMISEVILGVFFYLQSINSSYVSSLKWLPLVCLMVYISAFSLGMGPVPWILLGEFLPSNVKEMAGSLGASSNWMFAFVVTVTFEYIRNEIHDFGLYWMYGSCCFVAFLFSLYVPEVKGKSLREIENMFNPAQGNDLVDDEEERDDDLGSTYGSA